MDLLKLFNILVFILLVIYAVRAIRRISIGLSSLANYTILFIIFFNGLPLFLDVLFGVPYYGQDYIGLNLAISHKPSSYIYNIYITLLILILDIYAKRNKDKIHEINRIEDYVGNKKRAALKELIINYFSIIVILLPVFHVIISPYLSNYLTYGNPSVRGIFDASFNELNAMLRMNSIAVLSMLMLGKKKQGGFKELLLFTFLAFLLGWIDGKRYIIAFILVILFYIHWSRGKLIGKFSRYSIAGLILLFGFSVIYQLNIRADIIDYSTFEGIYRSFRMDFSRDAVVKMAIMSEITSFPPILEYRGQSFLALLLMYVPREIWITKPYQYTKYVTASILQISPEEVEYGVTFSILDQSIANFGLLFGMLFSVIFLLILIRIGDKSITPSTKLLVLLVIISSLTMNLAYIGPIIMILIIKILIDNYKMKKYSFN